MLTQREEKGKQGEALPRGPPAACSGGAEGASSGPFGGARHSGLLLHASSLTATLPFSSTEHIRRDRGSAVGLESAGHVPSKCFLSLGWSHPLEAQKMWFGQ